MRAIYKEAWAGIRTAPLFFLAMPLVLLAVDWIASSDMLNLVPWVFVAYALHRHFLLGEILTMGRQPVPTHKAAMGRFVIVTLGILLVPFLVIIGLVWATQPSAGYREPDEAIPVLLAALVSYGLTLVVFGTSLPAASAGEPFAGLFSLRRSRETALGIAGGLLVGPILVGTISMALTNWILHNFPLDLDITTDRTPTAAEVIVVYAREVLALIQATLAVVVLCRAYRKIGPLPVPNLTET